MTPADLPRLIEIDATIESARYFHVDVQGDGPARSWRIEERPLREKVVEQAGIDDELRFSLRQVSSGADEGLILVAEHEGALVAALLAQPRLAFGTLEVVDVRVDFDLRRQGIGSAMVYQAIQWAREHELRAVLAQTRTNNIPAGHFFNKLGFELSGLDTHLHSNHDLVKEAVALLWYAAMD